MVWRERRPRACVAQALLASAAAMAHASEFREILSAAVRDDVPGAVRERARACALVVVVPVTHERTHN